MHLKFNHIAIWLVIVCFYSGFSSSQSCNYLHFDRPNSDYISVPNASQYVAGAAGISMTGWFQRSSNADYQGFFSIRGPGTNSGEMYVILIPGGELECRFLTSVAEYEFVAPVGTITYDVWQHVAWVYDGSVASLYINGTLIGSTPPIAGVFNTIDKEFEIGRSFPTCCPDFLYGGGADEVTLWSKALSQAEILDMMANELTGAEAGLELYYKMNQGTGGANNTGIVQLTSEVGGFARNGTFVNFNLNGPTSNFLSVQDASFTFPDFCENALNGPVLTGDPGGTYSFNPGVSDGATIDPISGVISSGVTGTTYSVEYTLPACPTTHTETVTIIPVDQASFVISSFCANEPNNAVVNGTPGGTFTFDPPVTDGATIDPINGSVTNGVAGTTYGVNYTTNGVCSDTQTLNVTVTTEDDPSFTLNPFCPGEANGATAIASPGGNFAFDPDLLDGSSINPASGEISNGIANETYTVTYTTSGACQADHTETVTLNTPDDASFTLTSFCSDSPIAATLIATPGGTFSFDILPSDGATIDPSSGEINDGVENTTYDVLYTTNGPCPNTQVESVIVLESPSIQNVNFICSSDVTTYTVIFDIVGGDPGTYNNTGNTGTITGNSFVSDAIPNGANYDFTINDGNNCTPSNINGTHNCTCLASADLSGDVNVCPGVDGDLTIDFAGTGPWMFVYSIDLIDQPSITTFDNPYTLSNSTPGSYTLVSVTDANCVGSVSGSGSVTENTSPVISNVVETCSTDQLTYTVTFDISGGDVLTYSNTGTAGSFAGSTFTSDPILSGTNYSFTISDANNCATDIATGMLVCTCPVTADITGDVNICPGVDGDLSVALLGTAPWTFVYAIDLVDQPPVTTSISPYTLSSPTPGSYTISSVLDANCAGFVFGNGTITEYSSPVISNVIETCAPDQLTYTVTFDITGGDPLTYTSIGNTGTFTGNTFTSDPIGTGVSYDITVSDINNCGNDSITGSSVCICPIGATLSGDIVVCPGVADDLVIDFMGPGPWALVYAIDLVDQAPISTSDNPYILSTSTPGTYTLSYMFGSACLGNISGTATVVEVASNPVIGNVVETCSTDQLTYTVTFDITGGDHNTYNVTGNTGTISGNTFTSDPIASGSSYDFTVNDVNNCSTDNIAGTFTCVCPISATLSGDLTICPGVAENLTVDFTGTGPWTFVYAIDLVDQGPITTTDNAYLLSTSTVGNYTLSDFNNADCTGAFSGNGSVTENAPIVVNNFDVGCAINQLTYAVSFNISGGEQPYNVLGDPGVVVGDLFTGSPILSGGTYSYSVTDANSCSVIPVDGTFNCSCAAAADISGNPMICPGNNGDLTIDFLGTGPWTFVHAIDLIDQAPITTTDNPYILSTSTVGSYTLTSIDDVNCTGSATGFASVTEYSDPVISNVVETCSADQTTYTVTFDVTGGDLASYTVIGNTGTFVGNTFTSDPITSGDNYDFTVNDNNNCATDNASGTFNCTCPVVADLSGNANICPGTNGDLNINFVGTAPFTFVYAIDLIDQAPITTSDNPYTLSSSVAGSYALVSISDAVCTGFVFGGGTISTLDAPIISNVVESCSTDQTTYTVTFDVTGGDPTTYTVTGNTGSFVGNTFTSDPIASGANYDFTVSDINNCSPDNTSGTFNCTCPVVADLSGNVSVCPGVNGDLNINFVGTAPWTFVYAVDLVDQAAITTSDNPYTLSSAVAGSYSLTSVSDAVCTGFVFGGGTISQLDGPVISNVLETCSADLTTYIVTFDVTGGDLASYTVTGNTGFFVGNTFTSDPIASGTNYDFTVSDINNCSSDNINGSLNCSCDASATLSGDLALCQGMANNLSVDFTGTGPFAFVYAIDLVDQPPISTSDNPYLLPITTAGTYTLSYMFTDDCLGSVSGVSNVTEVTSNPVVSNIVETCAADQMTYTVTFDITGGDVTTYNNTGGNLGTFIGNTFTSDPIASGGNYDFLISDINNCSPENVTGTFNCSCGAAADISGDVNICPGINGDINIDFFGTGPWTFVYAIDLVDQTPITTSDNPYTLSTSTVGSYTLTSIMDVNCIGAVFGAASITEFSNPVISNVIETCSADQTTYTVSFDVTGGDVLTYTNTGDAGTFIGNTFTSDPIANGANYDFTISDINNCDTDNVSGSFNCVCDASATLSGDMLICPGAAENLSITFTGTGPFAFVYSIDMVDQAPISTSDNPYLLPISGPGTYALSYMFTDDCLGSVAGVATVTEVTSNPTISNLIETCSTDQLTYTVTFDVTGGDPTTYMNSGGTSGAFVGNTFTSDPIASGTAYDFTISDVNNCTSENVNGTFLCSCAASAEISGNINFCQGGNGNLTFDFQGTGPWTFVYAIDLVDQAPITTSDNPFILNTSIAGSYTLSSVIDLNCAGTVSGGANVIEYSSPVINNVVENCSTDQLTYTVTFDVIGGDPTSFNVVGNTGTFIGNTFTSDPIASGNIYDFTINDGNNCATDNANGTFTCTCPANATFSGDISICEGEWGFIDIDFEGTPNWSVEFELDGVPQGFLDGFMDPMTFPVNVPGTYTFSSISDANCISVLNDTVVVTNIPIPTGSISGDNVICEGEDTPITFTLTGDGPWDITYAIDNVVQSPIVVSSSPYDLNVADEGVYTIVSINNAMCSGTFSGSAAIVVNELPTASISGDIAICEDTPALLTINLTGSPDFDITYSLDNIVQPIITTSETSNLELSLDQEGSYELISISDQNCVGTVTGLINITSEPLPTASLNGDFTICSGTEQLIPVVLSGTADWTIEYTVDGVLQPPLSTTVTPFLIPGTLEGEYLIAGVTDNYCSNIGDGVANISFYEDLAISFSNNAEICFGEEASLWAAGSGGQGDQYDYTWSTTDLVSSTDSLAVYNPQSTTEVQVTITDDCNHSETFDIPITVNPLPEISISNEVNLCGPSFVDVINTTPLNFVGNSCLWVVNGDTVNNCNTLENFYDIGSYDINLQVTSPEGCVNDETFVDHINIFTQSSADFSFGPNTITTTNPLVQFVNESSSDVTYLEWQFSDLETSGEENPTYEFPIEDGPGDWQTCLFVNNDFGCADSICDIITVEGDVVLHIPNTFTPDGDGLNEFFYPTLIGADREDYVFRIYNRFGNIVFESEDIDEKWNGSLQNPDYYAPDGMYTWQLLTKVHGSVEKKEFLGSVIIIR